jgi:hypothetical protein
VERAFPSPAFNVQCEAHNILIKYFFSMPENVRSFNSKRKLWVFALSEYDSFISKMGSFSFVELHPLPTFLVQGIQTVGAKLKGAGTTFPLNIPQKIADALLPFQHEGVAFAVQHLGRCLIADEMGAH